MPLKKIGNILKWILLGLVGLILVGFIASEITIAVFRERARESELYNYETVTVDEVDIAYRVLVPEGDRTLIIVHGFLGSSYEYINLFDSVDLETFNTRVIALDTPGFGMSEKPEDYLYTNQTHADMLLKAIEALEIDTYTVLGHSLGGEIAQRMAYESDAVEALFLLDPVAPDAAMDPVRIPRLFYTVLFKNYWLQRLGFNSAPVDPLPKDVFRPALIQNHQIPSRVLQKFSEDVDTTYPIDFATSLTIPIFIAYGERDTWTPPELLDTYMNLYPQAEGTLIEGSGHLPYLEKPEITTSLIEKFINSD